MTIIANPANTAAILEITPTVNTGGAYASGQLIGKAPSGNGANAAPMTIQTPWPPGTPFLIQSVWLEDAAKQSAAIDLILFNNFPSLTTFTDSATLAVNAGDLDKLIDRAYNITQYDSFSANSIGSVDNLARLVVLPGASIDGPNANMFGALISRGTPTYNAVDDLRLRISVMLWQ